MPQFTVNYRNTHCIILTVPGSDEVNEDERLITIKDIKQTLIMSSGIRS
jgi:hypothetical protein